LSADPNALADDEAAMAALGVGKNMVRSIRFWVHVFDIAKPAGRGAFELTAFGQAIFRLGGYDPYLEDVRTLWLLHWNVSTLSADPLFAWDYILYRWPHSDMSRSELQAAFRKEAQRLDRVLSDFTLEQHLDIFLHTYLAPPLRKGGILEEALDSPFVELDFIRYAGERRLEGGRREPVYAFRADRKPEITPSLFAYCVNEFRTYQRRNEMTFSFRNLHLGAYSPGQVFKLPEWDIRDRLQGLAASSHGIYEFRDSADTPTVFVQDAPQHDFLAAVYQEDDHHE
jgi:hypothetical protein